MKALCRMINSCTFRFAQVELLQKYDYPFRKGMGKRFYSASYLREIYCKAKELLESKKLPMDVSIENVFACNELDLKEVNVYGFDYDYTLASYKPSMDYLLYNLGREALIKEYKYPEEISQLDYLPGFAVRGLHYDIEKGLLLKLDSFLQIQFGAVYRGLTPVSKEEVLTLYNNRFIPITDVETHPKQPFETHGVPEEEARQMAKNDVPLVAKFQSANSNSTTVYSKMKKSIKQKMIQLADLFSVPEMGLLCNVAEYFEKNHIEYHPEILFRDVKVGEVAGLVEEFCAI